MEEQTQQDDSITRLQVADREIVLLGTAHVSRESVEQVERLIEEERPDRVCVEIDAARYKTITEGQQWENLKIDQILKRGQGFLLLANLVLSSFQRRIGAGFGIVPGDEMKKAVEAADRLSIPYTFADREVQVTLRRAWARAGFFQKNKMLAVLFSSIFSKEKLPEEEIEALKKKSALQDMMEELAEFLPSVKEVLIDERDRYLASKIFQTKEKKVLVVIGAGHAGGIVQWLHRFEKGEAGTELSDLETVPKKGNWKKILPWIIPAAVVTLLVLGFVRSGFQQSARMLLVWILANGSLAALGALLALAHPLTVIVSFLAAPFTSMNPTIGVGIVSGLLESLVRKPRVKDFENLHEDMLSLKGFYRNRFTHILVVFFLSSIGSSIGTFLALPYLTALLT
ncbi:MAG: TraB/GumN family protein [Spirochaetales bacterium]|nr:TraB/GumN family protein [Spirochaetales bacterium]